VICDAPRKTALLVIVRLLPVPLADIGMRCGSLSLATPSINAEPAAAAAAGSSTIVTQSGAALLVAEPKKDAQGRDYLPVYGDEEQSPAPQPEKTAGAAANGKIRFYRNPMGLPDTSPVPKKDSMGMITSQSTKVTISDDGNTVKVSLDRIQRQRRSYSKKVQLAPVVRAIRVAGHRYASTSES